MCVVGWLYDNNKWWLYWSGKQSQSNVCIWTFEPKLDNDDTPLCRPNSAPKETGDRWSVQFNPKRGALHFRFPFDDTLYFKDDKTTEIHSKRPLWLRVSNDSIGIGYCFSASGYTFRNSIPLSPTTPGLASRANQASPLIKTEKSTLRLPNPINHDRNLFPFTTSLLGLKSYDFVLGVGLKDSRVLYLYLLLHMAPNHEEEVILYSIIILRLYATQMH